MYVFNPNFQSNFYRIFQQKKSINRVGITNIEKFSENRLINFYKKQSILKKLIFIWFKKKID